MKLLFLAPQPFFQERGTPIAVRLAIRVLAERKEISNDSGTIDLLTYHEGQDIDIPGVNLIRISAPRWLKGVGPGISCKKLLCDLIFSFTALRLVIKNRKDPYVLVHAVEEAAFIAYFLRLVFGIPYIYDMDSAIALQLTDKWKILRPLLPILEFFERTAVKASMAVVPVCDALAAIAEDHGSRYTHILRDISLLEDQSRGQLLPSLRSEIALEEDDLVLLYIGNLEAYQGVDLMLESFAKIASSHPHAKLVVIGGIDDHIAHYTSRAAQLGISSQTIFAGPRPVAQLGLYLQQADILLSPRTLGSNTPMKIYSYLHSGRAILATRLPTHTQVLDDSVAALAAPSAEDFSLQMERLITNSQLREELGRAGNELAERQYTFKVFKNRLNELYDRVSSDILPATA